MEPFYGQIQLFAFQFAPQGWLPCEGQRLPVSKPKYQALFALIGNRYGGDGQTNFALPDLRKKSPDENMRYYIAVSGAIFPPRAD